MEDVYTFCLSAQCSFVARFQIELNPADLAKINVQEYLYVDILDDTNEKLFSCLVFGNEQVEIGSAKLSKRCLNFIGEHKEQIQIRRIPFQFVNRGVPKLENINKPVVFASPELVEKYSNDVELVNVTNGYRMFVHLKSYESSHRANKVFINRYHLLLLGLEGGVANKLVITRGRAEEKAPFFKSLLSSARLFFHRIATRIGSIFIGYRELDLRVGHTYPFDESHKVIRMHPNIRKFLGLEENDRLVISYGSKRCSLPVLDLNTEHVEEVFKIKNHFIDSHLYIGIPATMRKQLAVPNIGSVIKARRSMSFLLKKHINKLILPLLALMFAIVSTIKAESFRQVIIIVILIIVISPLVIFASLSEERAKVK